MNKVILIGRLTKQPELKYTPQNTAVCSFSIAINRDYVKQGEQRQTDFINCVAWRNTAEFITKYFVKGQMIALVGQLHTRSYEKDGRTVYITEVYADEVSFCGDNRNQSEQTAAEELTPIYVENEDELPF